MYIRVQQLILHWYIVAQLVYSVKNVYLGYLHV